MDTLTLKYVEATVNINHDGFEAGDETSLGGTRDEPHYVINSPAECRRNEQKARQIALELLITDQNKGPRLA